VFWWKKKFAFFQTLPSPKQKRNLKSRFFSQKIAKTLLFSIVKQRGIRVANFQTKYIFTNYIMKNFNSMLAKVFSLIDTKNDYLGHFFIFRLKLKS
jgi:hypothetical protein